MILCPTSKCSPSRTWTGKIRTQFMNSWRAGALLWGRNSRLPTSSIMSPTTKMTLGGQPQTLFLMKNTLSTFATRWNFEKFLVNHEGQPVRRYDESLDPSELVSSLFHRWTYSVKVKTGCFNLFPSRRFQTSTFYWASASKTLHPRPSPTHIDTILRIQVWKSLPWSGHNDLSGLKLCCPVGDCVLTLWLLCIRVAVSQCCWMEETQ